MSAPRYDRPALREALGSAFVFGLLLALLIASWLLFAPPQVTP